MSQKAVINGTLPNKYRKKRFYFTHFTDSTFVELRMIFALEWLQIIMLFEF